MAAAFASDGNWKYHTSTMDADGTVPTKDELDQLPRLAIVAYAARCVRRVLPMILDDWQESNAADSADRQATVNQIDAIMTGVERYAGGDVIDIAEIKEIAERTAQNAARESNRPTTVAAVARAAERAVESAAAEPSAAADAAIATGLEALKANGLRGPGVNDSMSFDAGLLIESARGEAWNDDTLVRPEFFGPIWLLGKPEGQPEQLDESQRRVNAIQLEFTVPAEIDREEADRIIQQIILRANELHHAFGGSGLTIAEGRAYEVEPAYEPEPEPVGGPR